MNLDLKLRLIKCYVFSVLAYAAETWTYSIEIKRRIRAFEMWTYRRMLKISWTERVTNETVKQRVNVEEELVSVLARRKLKYAGHVLRGSGGGLLSLVSKGFLEGKRGRGRRKKMWNTDIKEWTGMRTFGEPKRRAEDRRRKTGAWSPTPLLCRALMKKKKIRKLARLLTFSGASPAKSSRA